MRQYEIQKAVYDVLNNGLTTTVYDDVPDQQDGLIFPYIVIGDGTSIPDSDDTYTGTNNTITIHAWSRYAGYTEVKNIMRNIDVLLNRRELVIEDADFLTCEFEFAEAVRDPDGETRHGIMRYRVIVTNV